MIYFDNAATGGFKPDSVINATTAAMKNCANAGRSGHKLSVACLERVYACRQLLCDFFGGYSAERVVFTKNCTEALNIALLGGLVSGDRVVTTVAEHNSVLRPLNMLQRMGVEVAFAHLNDKGEIDIDELISLVNKDTKAVVVTLASNVTGCQTDIVKLREQLPEQTLIICDGAQACGHIKIDMKSLGIDALAVAGHKGMLGVQGSGALIFSERFNPKPIMCGGTGSESFSLDMPTFYPDRLESGTISYPAIISLGEGALYLNTQVEANNPKTRLEINAERTLYLTKLLIDGLSKIGGIKVYSKPNSCGIVAYECKNIQSETVAYQLSEKYDICVRGGLHCAPLIHKALGTNGLVRASLCSFNYESEVKCLIDAMSEIMIMG